MDVRGALTTLAGPVEKRVAALQVRADNAVPPEPTGRELWPLLISGGVLVGLFELLFGPAAGRPVLRTLVFIGGLASLGMVVLLARTVTHGGQGGDRDAVKWPWPAVAFLVVGLATWALVGFRPAVLACLLLALLLWERSLRQYALETMGDAEPLRLGAFTAAVLVVFGIQGNLPLGALALAAAVLLLSFSPLAAATLQTYAQWPSQVVWRIGGLGLALVLVTLGLIKRLPLEIGLTALLGIVVALLVLAVCTVTGYQLPLLLFTLLLVLASLPNVAVDRQGRTPHDGADGVIVALGDSYMSGEGAGAYFPGTDVADENLCRRASTAYPWLVAERLEYGLVFAACSGATTQHVLTDAQFPNSADATFGARPQLDAVLGTRTPWADGRVFPQTVAFPEGLDGEEIAAVVISIGGNDALFGEIGATCVAPLSCLGNERRWMDNLYRRVGPRIAEVYRQVRDAVGDNVPILAMTYPQPLPSSRPPNCWATLEDAEFDFLVRFVARLNDVIEVAAARHRVHVVDARQAFDGGRICEPAGGGVVSPDNTFVHFVDLAPVGSRLDRVVVSQDVIRSSLHPKRSGHARLADALAAALPDAVAAPLAPEVEDLPRFQEVVYPDQSPVDEQSLVDFSTLTEEVCAIEPALRTGGVDPAAGPSVDAIRSVTVVGGVTEVTVDDVHASWPVCRLDGETGEWSQVFADARGSVTLVLRPAVTVIRSDAVDGDEADGEMGTMVEDDLQGRDAAVYVSDDGQRILQLTESCGPEVQTCAATSEDFFVGSALSVVRQLRWHIIALLLGAALMALASVALWARPPEAPSGAGAAPGTRSSGRSRG